MARRSKGVLRIIEEANKLLWEQNCFDAVKYSNSVYVTMDYLLLKSGEYNGYNCYSINSNGLKVLDKNGIVQFL